MNEFLPLHTIVAGRQTKTLVVRRSVAREIKKKQEFIYFLKTITNMLSVIQCNRIVEVVEVFHTSYRTVSHVQARNAKDLI